MYKKKFVLRVDIFGEKGENNCLFWHWQVKNTKHAQPRTGNSGWGRKGQLQGGDSWQNGVSRDAPVKITITLYSFYGASEGNSAWQALSDRKRPLNVKTFGFFCLEVWVQHLLVHVHLREAASSFLRENQLKDSYCPLLAEEINCSDEAMVNANEALGRISWDFPR